MTAVMVAKTLLKGSVVHVHGIPLELAADTKVNTTEGNFEQIERFRAEEAAAPTTGAVSSAGGDTR